MNTFYATQLGKLYCQDCFDVLPDIPENSIDMILCDLPYGTTKHKWDKRLPIQELWGEYIRIIKDTGVIALFAQQSFATDLINAGRKIFRYELIWEKSLALGFLTANKMPMRAHENILIFYKRLPNYFPQMAAGKPYVKKSGEKSVYGKKVKTSANKNIGLRYPRSVLKFETVNSKAKNHGHPTEKPQALFEWLIRTYTREGDIVLDNCVGSGTTAVAAENLKRRWIAVEKEEQFCTIAKGRLQSLEGNNHL